MHAGTTSFFAALENDLTERLNDKLSTTDLLKVLQAFSEVSSKFPALFVQLEQMFLKRFEQMNVDELTCCASGFAISGFGTPFMFKYLEATMLEMLEQFTAMNVKEICRAFVFTKRGTKHLYQVLMPRIQQILHTFTTREQLYILYGYHKIGFLPKPFLKELEVNIVQVLRNVEEVELEEVQLMTQVFCRSRVGSRDFHKLLETVILSRLEEIKTMP